MRWKCCLLLLILMVPAWALEGAPAKMGLAPFYKKYVNAAGIPVVASARVSDQALETAASIVTSMLSARADLTSELIRQRVRVAVMAPQEVTTDIPEHADLNRVFPVFDWNLRCRGVGATQERPACSCAEENLLQLPEDRYRGENILIHEFAHTVLQMGLETRDPNFRAILVKTYQAARAQRLWDNTYAGSNPDEYWAEGVQDWFDCNQVGSDGIHNHIHTQEQLRRYDPTLAALLAQVFPSHLAWNGRTLVHRAAH